MKQYLIKRFFLMIPTLLGITLITFTLLHFMPGGPVEMAIASFRAGSGGEVGSGKITVVTEEQRESLKALYGFDKPLWKRYFLWLRQLWRLDFGESYFSNEPVRTMIGRALPVSLGLGFFSLLFTYLVSIPLGIIKAVRNETRFDTVSSAILFLLYSIPPFALAVILIILFCGGSFWNLFPIEGMVSENFSELSTFQKITDYLHHLVLPLVCATVGSFAVLALLMKNSLLDELGKDYVTSARAKGLPEKTVVLKHALHNALLPLAHNVGGWLPVFFSGSLLLETIFNLQGVGRLSYDAILHRDYPIVLANIVILSVLSVVGNLVSDILYVLVDPRLDFEAIG